MYIVKNLEIKGKNLIPLTFFFNPKSLLFRLWLLRKPAFADTFALLEELQNRPEAREAEHTEQHRDVDVLDEQRPEAAGYSHNEKRRPALHAKVVFALDDERMKDADAQESSQAEYDTVIVHSVNLAAKLRNNHRNAKY